MEPRFFFRREMGGIPTSHSPTPRLASSSGGEQLPIPHSNTPHNPISPHIDEDALEGLYFAFSTILRCLLYFSRKTRPRASYELLEAFLPSLSADRGVGGAFPFPNPTLQHPTLPHLTPYRRGCPRRGLFRVFDHPNVFTLLFAKNASYDLLRAPRGILVISCRLQGESVESGWNPTRASGSLEA